MFRLGGCGVSVLAKAIDRLFRTDARVFTIAALVFLCGGILSLLLELQSPSFLLWSGQPVQGTQYATAVSYTYRGHQYVITANGKSLDHPQHVTVYVDTSNPHNAVLNRPATRWSDAVLVGGWFVVAIALVVVGQLYEVHRSRRRAARADRRPDFGEGIDLTQLEWRRHERRHRDS